MKILIIKLGALGDMIMATPVIRQLQQYHHNDSCYLLTTPMFTGLFQDWPDLTVKAFPRKGFLATCRTLCWLRQQGFRRIYDLQSNDRTGLLCALSGVPERAGNHPHFPYHFHPQGPYTGQCHAYERLNQILISAGIGAANETPLLPVSPRSKAHVKHWIEQHALHKTPFVLLHAGASRQHPAKRWPNYLGLAKELEREGLKVVWVGAEDDRDINHTLAREAGIDATGVFSVPELAELGKWAAFAVANDSAPMHILSCSGIPVYGLFGPSNWRRTHALGQRHHVISPGRSGDDETGFVPHDLAGISAAMVINRLRQDGQL